MNINLTAISAYNKTVNLPKNFMQGVNNFDQSLAEANAAYSGQISLEQDIKKNSKSSLTSGALTNVYDVLKESENTTLLGIAKKANASEVVASIASAEIYLRQMHTILQTVITSLNDIQQKTSV